MKAMRGLIVDHNGVLDGAEEDRRRWRKLLSTAREEGLATAIISNAPDDASSDPIRQWQEDGFVDTVVLSGEVGVEKSDEAIFKIAAERLELPVNDLVMVDDSIVNVKGAVEAGMIVVYYQQFDRMIVEVQNIFDLEGEF